MADMRYLKLRGDSYYFNRRVPKDLRARWSSGDPVCRALNTRDLTQAQSLRWTVNAEVEAAFAALQSGAPRKLTATEIEEIACAKFEATLQLAQECGLDAVAIEQSIAGVQAKLDLDDPAKGGRKGCIVDRDYALFRAEIAALDARRQALLGIQPAPPQTFGRSAIDPVTLQPVVPIRSKENADIGARFADIAERYLFERQRHIESRTTEQSLNQARAIHRIFDSFAPGARLGDVDRRVAVGFVDAISRWNPVWGRSPYNRGLAFGEIDRMFGNDNRGLSRQTLKRHINYIGQVWNYAERIGEFEGRNPWDSRLLPAASAKRATKRAGKRPYSAGEVLKMFDKWPPQLESKSGVFEQTTLPWLIFIAAYSGMRLEEICSLDAADVRCGEKGMWYFDIGQAKTEAGIRTVPLHDQLVEVGFLDYHARQVSGLLFPMLRPGGADSKFGHYPTKRFSELRRKYGFIDIDPLTGRDRLDFHSLRRSATQALKAARIPEHEADEITGHENGSMTYGLYAGRHDLPNLHRIVNAIGYHTSTGP